jgi:hypothetical protein
MSGVTSPLGFSANTASNTSFTGTEPVNLERYQSLNIDINNCVETEGINFGTTFCVPSNVDVLQIVDWSPDASFRQRVSFTHDTNLLQVRVKDDDNQVIDLHGAEWFFILRAV